MRSWTPIVATVAVFALAGCGGAGKPAMQASPAASAASAPAHAVTKKVELRKAAMTFQVPDSWLVAYKEDPASAWEQAAKEKSIPTAAVEKVKGAFDVVALDGKDHFVGGVSLGVKFGAAADLMVETIKGKCTSGFTKEQTKTPAGNATSFSCTWSEAGKNVPIHGVAGEGGKGVYLVVGMLGGNRASFDSIASTLAANG